MDKRLVGKWYKEDMGETINIFGEIPEDATYKYVPTEIYVPGTDKTRIKILKQYAEYDRSRKYGCGNEFVLGGDVPQILEKYNYSKYISGLNHTDDELIFRLLDFVCDHFGHNGSGGLGSGRTITDLITFCETNDNKLNCRGLSILLASLLRLNGIKAQHITCLPYEDPFEDCHVVVDCLLPSGKRIMLDPTWRLYLKDKEGNYISLSHLRELLLADEPIFENPAADYNGTGFDKEYYRNYMKKNTLRFAHCTLNKDGVDGRTEGSRYIELLPQGYPTENFSEQRKADFVYNDIEFWQM